MTFAFARIGAVVAMRVEDYYPEGKRWWVRLHEKGGKRHEMPAHHKLEAYIDEYLLAAGIRDEAKGPLFRSAVGKTGVLTATLMNRVDAYRMVRRRAAEAGFKQKLGCHVFRATGITAYLEAGGTLENAQAMAAHESPRTTNGSENDIRCQVTRRKISGGTRSDIGRDCRDAFLSLAKTCAKLGIAFWDYLGDRLATPIHLEVPYLPGLVTLRGQSA
jgi:integrase